MPRAAPKMGRPERGKIIPFPQQKKTEWRAEQRQKLLGLFGEAFSFLDETGMFDIADALIANVNAYDRRHGFID
jgi:hypothetical protein